MSIFSMNYETQDYLVKNEVIEVKRKKPPTEKQKEYARNALMQYYGKKERSGTNG